MEPTRQKYPDPQHCTILFFFRSCGGTEAVIGTLYEVSIFFLKFLRIYFFCLGVVEWRGDVAVPTSYKPSVNQFEIHLNANDAQS